MLPVLPLFCGKVGCVLLAAVLKYATVVKKTIYGVNIL